LPAGCRGRCGGRGRVGAEHAGGRAAAGQVRGKVLFIFLIIFKGEIEMFLNWNWIFFPSIVKEK
jgi:hypothetical protein